MSIFNLFKKNNKVKDNRPTGPISRFENFDIDKAYALAEEEYLHLNNKSRENLIEEEKMLIYDNAANEITYFLTWLIRRGLISDKLRKKIDDDTIAAFNDKTANPRLFVRNVMDCTLSKDDIKETIHFFTSWYLGKPAKEDYIFSHKNRVLYIFDYFRTVVPRNEQGFPIRYSFSFSWETYEKLEKVLDESYEYGLLIESEGRSSISHDKGSFYSNVFNTEIKVKAKNNVTDDYIEKCKTSFDEVSSKLYDELMDEACTFINKDVPVTKDYLLSNLKPTYMNIDTPANTDEVAFWIFAYVKDDDNILLNAFNANRSEPTTMLQVMIGWTIRNGVLVAVYSIDQSSNPWEFEGDLEYRKKVASQYELIKQPVVVRGIHDPEILEIKIPSILIPIKDYYVSMMEALITEGFADYYTIKPIFNVNSDIPKCLEFEARKMSVYNRLVFSETLDL